MKATARDTETYWNRPDAGLAAVLIYGPDNGLVRERRGTVVKAVAGSADDPFRVATLSAADVAADGAALHDEINALSFDGGRRVVVVGGGTDRLADDLVDLVDTPARGALLVIEAGDLPPRSKLRKLFEKAAHAVAIPCYADDIRGLHTVVEAAVKKAGLAIDPDAREVLCALLGGDRMASRQEIDKLILYKGNDATPITVRDVENCVGDVAGRDLENLIIAAFQGRTEALERGLIREFETGESPVAVLRTAGRLLLRLQYAAELASSLGPEGALKKLRPPVFFKQMPGYKRLLALWTPRRLDQALQLVTDTEIQCKSTGMPADVLCRHTLLRIARGMQATAGNRR
jgi:DNA polymerase-3 subunit delta